MIVERTCHAHDAGRGNGEIRCENLESSPKHDQQRIEKDCQDGQIYEAAATGSDQEGAEKHSTSRARNNLAVENMAVI